MAALRTALAAVAFALALPGLAGAATPSEGRSAPPAVKAAKGDACVAPTPLMRRDHMKMLMHQRDRTVRRGVREPRFSLKGCIECHADRETGSVLGKDGFCESCHAYAAVSLDCFDCHTPMRANRVAARP